jgi:hypothetical protein
MQAGQMAALSRGAQERLQRTRIVERYALARTAARAVAVLGVVWLARQAIGDLAGQVTSLTISTALSVVADLRFTALLTLAGGSAAWAWVERKLRHRKVEKLQARIVELETAWDRRHSSSGLTPAGKTNPRDKRK